MPIVGHEGDRYVVSDQSVQRFSQSESSPFGTIMREILFRQLQPVRQRQWAERVVRATSWGLATGSIAAAVLGILRLVGWLSATGTGWGVLLGLPMAAAASAAVWGWFKTDWLPAARAVDGHYELKDRTETALAFLRREHAGQGNQWEQLQLAATAQPAGIADFAYAVHGCQEAIVNRAAQNGFNSVVVWAANLQDNAGNNDVISGNATAVPSRGGNQVRIQYQCTVDAATGRVIDLQTR